MAVGRVWLLYGWPATGDKPASLVLAHTFNLRVAFHPWDVSHVTFCANDWQLALSFEIATCANFYKSWTHSWQNSSFLALALSLKHRTCKSIKAWYHSCPSTNMMQMGREGFHLGIPLSLTDNFLYLFWWWLSDWCLHRILLLLNSH